MAEKRSAFAQAIIDGKHDAILDDIIGCAEWRKKKVAFDSGIRKGARVRVADDKRRAAQFAGREGTVVKVNKVRTTVRFACPDCGKDTPDPGTVTDRVVTPTAVAETISNACHTCWGTPDEPGIPTDLLTLVRS